MANNSTDLRKLPLEDLNEKLEEALKARYGLRLRAVTKELTDTSAIRVQRRDIARIKQAIAEKSVGETPAGDRA